MGTESRIRRISFVKVRADYRLPGESFAILRRKRDIELNNKVSQAMLKASEMGIDILHDTIRFDYPFGAILHIPCPKCKKQAFVLRISRKNGCEDLSTWFEHKCRSRNHASRKK